MEKVTVISVLITVVCIVVVKVLFKVVNWAWLKPKKLEKLLRNQGFSGTSYKLMFGDLKELMSMRNQALNNPITAFSHQYFRRVEPLRHHLAVKFGSNNNFLWLGPIPVLSISNPELIREILTNINIFQKPKLNPLADKLLPGLFSYEGDKWAKHRKLINPAFHMQNLKLMVPSFRESCAEVINEWEKSVHEMGSVEVDVWPDLIKLTADAISRAAFGSNYKQGQHIFELLKEQIDLSRRMTQSIYYPGKRHIPTARNRRFNEIEHQINTSLRAIINKRKEEMEAGEAAKEYLLRILMDSNSKEIELAGGNNTNEHTAGMSLAEVIEECKLFYIAGQKTTSILLVWTMILLSKHQDWQARAREEVMRTFGDNVPDYEGLSHLKTVTMILYEVLRLYPPAMQTSRWIHNDTTLGTYTIPSGALITFYLYHVHRNQEIWGDDVHEFKPERFAEGISNATKGHNSFYPFGWGSRICIGEKFAMTEAKLVVSMILKRFSLELSPSYVHAPTNVVIFLEPQHGANIILHKL